MTACEGTGKEDGNDETRRSICGQAWKTFQLIQYSDVCRALPGGLRDFRTIKENVSFSMMRHLWEFEAAYTSLR